MAEFREIDDFIRKGQRSQGAQDARAFRDTYEGDQEQFLQKNPQETDEDWQAREKSTINLTRQIIDQLSGLYCRDPKREYAPEAAEDPYTDVFEASQYNLGQIECDAMTRLLGVTAWQAFWEDDLGQVGLRLITRDNFDVWTVDGRPDRPEFVLVYLWVPGDSGRKTAKLYSAETVWTYMSPSPDSVILERLISEPNPYGALPFVFAHNRLVTDNFYTPGLAWSICPQNWLINKKLTELVQVQIERSYPQRWIKGVEPGESIVTGVKRVLHLTTTDAEIGQLSPDLGLSEVFETVEKEIQLLLASSGVPENSFRLNVSATSGVQVRAEQEPLIADRRKRTKIFQPVEHAVVDLVRTVHNVHSTSTQIGEVEFHVTFKPEPEPIPGPEQTADQQFRLDAKIDSRVDIRMERHPDETREEAEAALAQVDEDNAAAPQPMESLLLGGRFGGLDNGEDEDEDEDNG